MGPWQRHSEPGPAARAEAVVAPPRTKRPGCARSRQGTEFAESRFRASRVTFVRRQRPHRRSPRSRSSGCCSARAKRSSHRCRDKRCSVSDQQRGGRPLGWLLGDVSESQVRLQVAPDQDQAPAASTPATPAAAAKQAPRADPAGGPDGRFLLTGRSDRSSPDARQQGLAQDVRGPTKQAGTPTSSETSFPPPISGTAALSTRFADKATMAGPDSPASRDCGSDALTSVVVGAAANTSARHVGGRAAAAARSGLPVPPLCVPTSSELGVDEGGCFGHAGESQVRLQVAANQAGNKHTDDSRNRG